ncbi:type IV pilus assembly protein PilM [Leifsonia sp. C5G2]|uniref:type IV pilus assembly protein PilM n=1 Tax=Leifsonia sp. C5G2 TaxID=2735269 RepID=UPI001584D033|nr:type IV pilus assembly protein PilM [Leifsonia sp. C5G2]NUU06985.1 type IV pilus assembly protein PilM [Leifsonia sp. C5G2]
MATSIVGVDIGNGVLRAVEVADAAKPRPTLLRHAEVALPEGAASRGEVLEPNTVAAALRQLWSIGGFKSKNVILGMGNQRVLARDLSMPAMSLERIKESLPFHVQDMLPVPVAEALLDFYPVSHGQGESGPVVNGLLVAAVKDAVLANVRAAELAGLTPVDVDLIPFALNRVLVTRPRLAGSIALIQIGSSTTTVVISVDGVPHFVRIIPTGGADLTEALYGGLEIAPHEAEAIKRSLGLATQVSGPDEQRAVEIIYLHANELLTSLRNTVNYFVNTRADARIDGVVLTGGGASLRGLPDALAEMTRLPVTTGDPFLGLGLSRSLDADELRAKRSSLAVALGLTMGRAA